MGKAERIDWPSLKTLEKGQKEFTANGKEYRIYPNVSFERWRDMQRLEIELSFGTTMSKLVASHKEIYELLNKQRFADAAVECRNAMLGLASIGDDRWPTVLRMCCLFVNYRGENIDKIDESVIAEKINDWKEEGYDMGSFFRLALGAIPDFLSAYQSVSQSISPSPQGNASTSTTNEGSKA